MPRFASLATLALLAAACADDVVDPTTGATEPAGTTTTTTDATTDAPTSNGPFPDPSDTDPTALCDAVEPVAEPDFPAAMATRVCAWRTACGCAGPTCTVDVAAALSDMATWSKGQQLAYDPDCAAALYARADAIGCDDQITAIAQGCASCNIYRGARPPGQACETNFYTLYATQCAPGHACSPVTDVCTATELPEVGPGQPCFAGTTIARCTPDAVCDSANTGTCVPAPAVDSPCFAGTTCAAGQFCDPGAICRAQRPVGQPCTSLLECQTLECTANVCTSTPWICRPQWSAGA